MWPFIGSLKTYMVFYSLSMVAQMWLAIGLCRRRGSSWKAGLALGLCYLWSMCIGARILYDLMNSRFDWHNYLEISYYFEDGLWGGPLAYLAVATLGVVLFARDRRVLLDVVALTLPIPMILAKVACFVNGCCYGATSTVPWAMSLAKGAAGPTDVPRHPTPLYEIIALMVVFIVLVRLDGPRWKGTLIAWFVLLYGLGRPLTELFRASDELRMPIGGFSSSQIACVAAAILAAVLLPFLRQPRQDCLVEQP